MKFKWKKFILIVIVTFIVGSFFSIFTMNNINAYNELKKPLQIPNVIFPIVWSILFLLMSISCYIISESNSPEKNKALIIYTIQLIINSLWSLIFFGLGQYLLSFIWILILIILVIVMIIKFYKIKKIAAIIQIPYLLWIIFASYLNIMIYVLNR